MKYKLKRLAALTLLCVMLLGITVHAEGESTLSGLTVTPGSISPEFSPEVTDYTVTVSAEDKKLAVSAQTTDPDAKYVVSDTDLEVGENLVTVVVTSADGSLSTTYNLNVVRPEEGTASSDENGETADSTDLAADENDPGETDAQTQSTDTEGYTGIDIWVSERSYKVLEPDDSVSVPGGYRLTDIIINGERAKAWESGSSYLIYCENESGQRNLYRFDPQESTMQRYIADGGGISLTAWIIIGVMAVVIIALVVVLVGMTGKAKGGGEKKDRRIRELPEKNKKAKKPAEKEKKRRILLEEWEEDDDEEIEDIDDETSPIKEEEQKPTEKTAEVQEEIQETKVFSKVSPASYAQDEPDLSGLTAALSSYVAEASVEDEKEKNSYAGPRRTEKKEETGSADIEDFDVFDLDEEESYEDDDDDLYEEVELPQKRDDDDFDILDL